LSEEELQSAVIELAHLFGWVVAHFRPAKTERGWRTAVSADGAGFPDLVLVRERVIFAELKSQRGHLSEQQRMWSTSLVQAGAEIYTWRPAQWTSGEIEAVLRERAPLRQASQPGSLS
jgi:VRR-NUC domain